MAYTFLKVVDGVEIGKSLFDEEVCTLCNVIIFNSDFQGAKIVKELVDKAKSKNVKLHFPVDFVIASEIKDGAENSVVDVKSGIPADKMVLFIEKTIGAEIERHLTIFRVWTLDRKV